MAKPSASPNASQRAALHRMGMQGAAVVSIGDEPAGFRVEFRVGPYRVGYLLSARGRVLQRYQNREDHYQLEDPVIGILH
jgi:hypothetical protein